MVTITLTIPDARAAVFLARFLKVNPVPDENQDGVPDFTSQAWVKEWIKRALLGQVRTGERVLFQETFSQDTADSDIS